MAKCTHNCVVEFVHSIEWESNINWADGKWFSVITQSAVECLTEKQDPIFDVFQTERWLHQDARGGRFINNWEYLLTVKWCEFERHDDLIHSELYLQVCLELFIYCDYFKELSRDVCFGLPREISCLCGICLEIDTISFGITLFSIKNGNNTFFFFFA